MSNINTYGNRLKDGIRCPYLTGEMMLVMPWDYMIELMWVRLLSVLLA